MVCGDYIYWWDMRSTISALMELIVDLELFCRYMALAEPSSSYFLCRLRSFISKPGSVYREGLYVCCVATRCTTSPRYPYAHILAYKRKFICFAIILKSLFTQCQHACRVEYARSLRAI